MSMRVEFTLSDDGVDEERLSADSSLLLEELGEAGFDRLGRAAAGPAPAGTRPADVITVATLVAVLSSPTVLKASTEIVTSWLKRRGCGKVRIKIGEDELEVTPSAKEQKALIEAFLARHQDAGDGEP